MSILTDQRDRYRQLNKELQEKLLTIRSQVAQLEKEVFSLKKDNRELYEKLRYTQSYQREVMMAIIHVRPMLHLMRKDLKKDIMRIMKQN